MKLNLPELLQGYSGIELWSLLEGKVKFDKILDNNQIYPIQTINEEGESRIYTADGKYTLTGECLLTPTKEIRDWDLWRVSYVIFTGDKEKDNQLKVLLGYSSEENSEEEGYIGYRGRVSGYFHIVSPECEEDYNYILSTGKELRQNSRFKIGDVIVDTSEDNEIRVVVEIQDGGIRSVNPIAKLSHFVLDDSAERVYRLATTTEIDFWNDEILGKHNLHYSVSQRRIILWFREFDKVIVRNKSGDRIWRSRTFDQYNQESTKHYGCQDYNFWEECIPYNKETSKLIGTSKDWNYGDYLDNKG